jgi:hypothetical protein
MTNLSDTFAPKAAGLPRFETQGLFNQLAAVTDGYSPSTAPSLDSNSELRL